MSEIDTEVNVAEEAPTTADGSVKLVPQAEQLKNPDARVAFDLASGYSRLDAYGRVYQGIGTSDASRFIQRWWEGSEISEHWVMYQMAPELDSGFSGLHSRLLWCGGAGPMTDVCQKDAQFRGKSAWGRRGVALSVTGGVYRGEYVGNHFDCTFGALVAINDCDVAALHACVMDKLFVQNVRKVDQALSITETSFGKVPFDLAYWQKVAAEKYPNGLPEPQSDDPTQWIFHGHPAGSVPLTTGPSKQAGTVLQVAVARLAGYRWPAELDPQMRLAPEARAWVARCKDLASHADDDGVIPLVPMRGEPAAEGRVRDLLRAAFGFDWSSAKEATLLAAAASANGEKSPSANLDDWLKNRFFAEHCALFHHRPFVWHIWDGRKKDGFGVLVHYHRLTAPNGEGRRLLEKITHGYLGDWIGRQRDEMKANKPGADARLAAALDLQKKLEAILAGEPPFDIFVRWKPLHEQPIGWEPDINDGVRMNIRPFIEAGVLRDRVNVKWTKDRGKEPQTIRPKDQFPWFWSCPEETPPIDFAGGGTFAGERLNNLHYTRQAKEAARRATGRAT